MWWDPKPSHAVSFGTGSRSLTLCMRGQQVQVPLALWASRVYTMATPARRHACSSRCAAGTQPCVQERENLCNLG